MLNIVFQYNHRLLVQPTTTGVYSSPTPPPPPTTYAHTSSSSRLSPRPSGAKARQERSLCIRWIRSRAAKQRLSFCPP